MTETSKTDSPQRHSLSDTGLSAATILALQTALFAFAEVQKAVLYGSRAKGTYRPGSDIDVTLYLTSSESLNLLHRIAQKLDDLNLANSVDLSIASLIHNQDLLDHIDRVGIELYSRAGFSRQLRRQEARLEYEHDGTQSEAQLEENLIQRLSQGLGYERIRLRNVADIKHNLKTQLGRHNKITLSDGEFSKVLNHLDKGNIFERAKTLRDRFRLERDDGRSCYLQFFNSEHWCQNQYQVTQQIRVAGERNTRFDVTLLINGLPLVQIELKRRGIELKEAFTQIQGYQKDAYWAESGLFNYVQLFVISNGVNTKYYANNRKMSFKQTFFWADKQNQRISHLEEFADVFLEKCHVSKMISQYIVSHESDKVLMILRSYQYYAVEAIVDKVQNGRRHGYVWHTTGSGKTLTSFKAAQILTTIPKVHKVMFVVDRADLDYQTQREFNAFSKGSVDETKNTKSLVKQITGDNSLIVTTIQKLNSAIKSGRHEAALAGLQDKRVVFIFDECHRSQFGDTHKNIMAFFTKAQIFGFTGTPIVKKNAAMNQHGKRTTEDLFKERLHEYVITNAISDKNVLPFSIEYWGKIKQKDGTLMDEPVSSLDKKGYFENPERIEGVVDWIIAHHGRKTHQKQFSAMLCVSSKEMLMTYYDDFQRKKAAGEHDLRIATIFTFAPDNPDEEHNGEVGEPNFDVGSAGKKDGANVADGELNESRTRATHKDQENDAEAVATGKAQQSQDESAEVSQSRAKLEEYVQHYNAMYQTSHSVRDSKSFYAYYKDIAKRMKERDKASFKDKDRCDILLVVNMFLTGFDAKKLNTIYVDKNLKYHGLIQAFSRTNRIFDDLKSQGNVVCFRNIKKNADEALALFSDVNADTKVFIEPYEDYVQQFNELVILLREIAETPQDVDDLLDEDSQLRFVKTFRHLLRTLNVVRSFAEFAQEDLAISEQEFVDYRGKYMDLYDHSRKSQEQGASIIEDLDFELELIQRDEVNVSFILNLLAGWRDSQQIDGQMKDAETIKHEVAELLAKEPQLRSKRELIERFIHDYMPQLPQQQDVQETFSGFWMNERRKAIHQLCETEKLDKQAIYRLIDTYHFTGKEPLREQVFAALRFKPKLMERKKIFSRVLNCFKDIVHKFDEQTGSFGSQEDWEKYEAQSIDSFAYNIGDTSMFFGDELRRFKQCVEMARVSIRLDETYDSELSSLLAYDVNSKLISRGVISEAILTQYLQIIAELKQQLADHGMYFWHGDHSKESYFVFALDEARQGSLLIDIVLFGVAVNVGLSAVERTMKILKDYPGAAEGLEHIKQDLKRRYSKPAEKTVIELPVSVQEEINRLRNKH